MGESIALDRVRTPVWGVVRLLRPKQWIKNGFVLAPLIFSGEFLNIQAIISSFCAFFLFCLASSATYVVNDLQDIERDRLHPKKSKTRPLAAGIISSRTACMVLALLYSLVVFGCVLVPPVGRVIIGYLVLNFAYTFILKHEPVVDIFTIAIGFVLRVYAGAIALNVQLSSWMFITTLCLALYLAAVKRRQELCQSGLDGREVLEKYTVPLVDRYAEMSATGALLFYSMFVMSAKPALVASLPLVLFGIFRYWFVVEALDGGESPTDALLADWQLSLAVLLWILVCVWVLWPL
jgi:4-hydroxybenzoate polyprenyltransferase